MRALLLLDPPDHVRRNDVLQQPITGAGGRGGHVAEIERRRAEVAVEVGGAERERERGRGREAELGRGAAQRRGVEGRMGAAWQDGAGVGVAPLVGGHHDRRIVRGALDALLHAARRAGAPVVAPARPK